MKTKIFLPALLIFVGSTGPSVLADDVVKPTPAPIVADAANQNSVEEPAVIDHVVFLAKLPSPDELTRAANQKGTPILRMDQTSDRIVVVYQYSGGRTVAFAYALLSASGSSPAPAAPTRTTDYQVVTPSPAPPATVVYAEPSEVYYAPRVRYYDPAWDFWSPFALGIGLGWVGGGWHGHGSWHGNGGGWHGHGGGWHHR